MNDEDMLTFLEMYSTLDIAEASGILVGLIQRVIKLEKLSISEIQAFAFLIMEAKKVQVED